MTKWISAPHPPGVRPPVPQSRVVLDLTLRAGQCRQGSRQVVAAEPERGSQMRPLTINGVRESKKSCTVVDSGWRKKLITVGGTLKLAQRGLDACYVVAVGYLCLVALCPTSLPNRVPSWFRWFGAPGSWQTTLALFALPALHLLVRRSAGKKLFVTGAPIILIAVMAASALVLGMSAYLRCAGDQTPVVIPLAWTLELFLGQAATLSSNSACAPPLRVPVALDIAQLLAAATVLTTASAAALSLFRSQLDRIAIWRAQKLTVVVGVDVDTVTMVRAITGTTGPGETVVVLTDNGASNAARAVRDLGAIVRLVDLNESESLAQLPLWTRTRRLYLLSDDPVQNLKRFKAIDAQIAKGRDDRIRLPLIVRIDDPWQAEVWRRSFLADTGRRWVADAIGRFEITSANLVRHMTTKRPDDLGSDPPSTVMLCGLHPLTYAIACELAQLQRDQELYPKPHIVRPDNVMIFAPNASSFVRDHQMRQGRIAPDGLPLPLTVCNAEPTVDSISEYLQTENSAAHAVVLCNPSMAVQATRLASRFPDLRVYLASNASTSLVDFSIVGRLYNFPISLEPDADAPQDVWERAAELIHELYSDQTDRTQSARHPWKELSRFYKQSNRRQVHNALWMVEAIANHTWNSLEHGSAAPLSSEFLDIEPLGQLSILGFDEQTVERMIQAEHEDWRKYYERHGWKYSEIRDDTRRRHDKLLPWEELVDRYPESRHNACRSLASTLRNLRALGYRSTPRVSETSEQTASHVS
jgi:hypothetical protein